MWAPINSTALVLARKFRLAFRLLHYFLSSREPQPFNLQPSIWNKQWRKQSLSGREVIKRKSCWNWLEAKTENVSSVRRNIEYHTRYPKLVGTRSSRATPSLCFRTPLTRVVCTSLTWQDLKLSPRVFASANYVTPRGVEMREAQQVSRAFRVSIWLKDLPDVATAGIWTELKESLESIPRIKESH